MSRKTDFTEELADVMRQIDDLKEVEKGIIQAAKDSGEDVKVLRKVAREKLMDSEKLQLRFEFEEKVDALRGEVGLRSRKGLVMEAA
jgi:uncharacterized protein (UPF0335 family)